MTAPHVGNTGMNDEDPESSTDLGGRVRRPRPGPPPVLVAVATRSLDDALRDQGVVGISGIDTRALTRHLRERGAMRVGISSTETSPDALLERVRGLGRDVRRQPLGRGQHERAVRRPGRGGAAVHRRRPRPRHQGQHPADDEPSAASRPTCCPPPPRSTTCSRCQPDGLFFSNGPGDPAATTGQVEVLQGALERGLPYFGICFGNQLFGRALGFGTYKLDLRSPRHQPAGDGPHHRQGRGDGPQPRVRRRRPAGRADHHAVRRRDRLPRLPQRRRGRGPGAALATTGR